MPPLPKPKYPKSRQGKRRSHLRLRLPNIVQGPAWCPYGPRNCSGPRISHTACSVCGLYRGRRVLPGSADGEPQLP